MKKIFLIISILSIGFTAKAQFLNSPSLQLIEKALQKGVFLVESSYQLYDSAENAFGRNGQNEFSIFHSLGIKTSEGYIFSHQSVYPWMFDKDFYQYKQDFSPVVLQETYKYNEYEIEKGDVYFSSKDSLVYFLIDKKNTTDGFEIQAGFENMQGWISWIYDNDSSLTLATYTKKVEKPENIILEEPQNSLRKTGELIGGVFVVPEYEIGTIRFQLCGVIVRKDESWILTFPFSRPEEKSKPIDSKGLTPIR